MNPLEATISCFRKSFDWSGRAPRSELWWFVLAQCVLFLALELVVVSVGLLATGAWIFAAAVLIVIPAQLAVCDRRLHDVDRWGGGRERSSCSPT